MIDELRRRAEEFSKKSSVELSKIPPENVRALLHELHVNQVELERQNEELRRAQVELAETRDRYADLYEFAPVSYVTLDEQRTVRETNLTFTLLLGIERSRIIGRKLDDFVAPYCRDACFRNIRSALTTHHEQTFETLFQVRDGVGFWGLVKCVPLVPDGHGPVGCRVAVTNITALKSAETMLQASMERLELALEAGGMGLWDRDLEREEIMWNDRLYRLLGYQDRVAVTTETFFEHIHDADRSRVRRHVEEVLENGGTEFVDEFRVVRRDGAVRWFAARGRVAHNSRGEPVRMTGVSFDTTLWKEEEARLERLVEERTAELADSERRYRELVENMEDIVYSLDGAGILRFVSPQVERYGLRVEDVVGRHFLEFVVEEDRERMKANLHDILYTGGASPSLFRLRNPENRTIWMEETGSLQRDASNRLLGATGVLRDVTKRIAAEQRNMRQREALRMLTLRLNDAQEEERQRIAAGLHDEVAQLLAACQIKIAEADACADANERRALFDTANRLLDEASDQIRGLTFELSSKALFEGGFVAAVAELCEHMARRYNVELELECPEPDVVVPGGECTVLYRGLRELLYNVIKHARSRRAEVCIKTINHGERSPVDADDPAVAGATERSEREAWRPASGGRLLRVTVCDAGVGFDTGMLEQPLTRKGGFGLSYLRERMESIGGWFHIESVPGDGTKAVMGVPLDKRSRPRRSENE